MLKSNNDRVVGVPDRYICPSCCRTIRDPMQFPCGHRCCKPCIKDDGSGYITCCGCQEKATRHEIFADRGFQRDMERLVRDYPLSVRNGMVTDHQIHEDRFVITEGISLWSISQVQKKLGDSQSAIFASTFVTHPSGYRMHLSLTIDRSEKNHSRYLSLSFNLIRGEKDAILPWPFDYQMTFSLFNRNQRKNHFLISFRSDRTSASFQRPQSEMNDAFCIPKFVPLAALEQTDSPYIDGNSIFIEMLTLKHPASIDLLPSLMDIDLALPVEIQKHQIEWKSQKDREQSIYELERSLKKTIKSGIQWVEC